VAALLAIMKAGDACVVLDPADPPAQQQAMLDEAAVAVLIAGGAECAAIAPPGLPVLRLDADAEPTLGIDGPPSPPPGHEDPAYLAFASAFGGQRAVEVPHRACTNLLWSMARRPGFGPDDVMIAASPLGSGMAVVELFLPLVAGGRVILASEEAARSPRTLAELIERSGATVMQATPSRWRALLDAGFRPRCDLKMLCGGEPLTRGLADRLLSTGAELWSLYGTAGAAVWSSAGRVVPGEDPITIGAPLLNTQLHVLDGRERLAPVGAVGTLHIGGAGLACGYFLRPDLTERAFREVMLDEHLPRRLLRTGDLARRLPDGAIELVGRADAAPERTAAPPALAWCID
jgi:non-ribosomal peptide synthetase component F